MRLHGPVSGPRRFHVSPAGTRGRRAEADHRGTGSARRVHTGDPPGERSPFPVRAHGFNTMRLDRSAEPPPGRERAAWVPGAIDGGGGGIRTPDAFRHAGFQNRCIQPLCHASARTGPAAGDRIGPLSLRTGTPRARPQEGQPQERQPQELAAARTASDTWIGQRARRARAMASEGRASTVAWGSPSRATSRRA